jgi:endonuclease/exonuclease/phosphatase family metal-dependent hydrolase
MALRIGKAWLRITVWVIVVAIPVPVLWFAGNRLLCGLWAVQVHKLEAGGGEGESEAEFDGRLRIAAYNIARGGGIGGIARQDDREAHLARLQAIGEMLRAQRVDVAVLNEVDFGAPSTGYVNQTLAIARAGGFPHCIEQCNYDLSVPYVRIQSGNAVLSRYPVREARLATLPPHKRWEAVLAGHKKGVLVEVQPAPDLRFHILGTHLAHRSEAARVSQARHIESLREEAELPFVVAGDLNSTPLGFPTARETVDGENAMSLLLGSGGYRTRPTETPEASDFTFPTRRPVKVIDWILVPPGWRIVSKEVVACDLSDHLPVVMEVEVGEPGATTP